MELLVAVLIVTVILVLAIELDGEYNEAEHDSDVLNRKTEGVNEMAIVFQAWSISLQFKDRDNNTSTVTAYQGDQVPFVDVETFASLLGNRIAALSDAVLVGYSISRNAVEDAAPVAPEGSDVERKGRFTFQLADTRQTSISVPSIINSAVVDGTNVINRLDPAVVAFVAALEGTGTDSIGTDVIRLLKAEKRHIKNPRG